MSSVPLHYIESSQKTQKKIHGYVDRQTDTHTHTHAHTDTHQNLSLFEKSHPQRAKHIFFVPHMPMPEEELHL